MNDGIILWNWEFLKDNNLLVVLDVVFPKYLIKIIPIQIYLKFSAVFGVVSANNYKIK
jgi:hypothetical protein